MKKNRNLFMKNKIATYTLLLIGITTFAQSSSKAQLLLNEVSANMATYQNMYFKFKYILENKEVGMKQESDGFVTTENEKYNLEFMGTQFIHDGENTYVIVPEDEEVNIVEGGDEEATLTPSKLLSFYKEGFTYVWDQSQQISDIKIQFIKLIPIDSKAESSYFMLGINSEKKQIYNIKEVGNNGTETLFEIEDFKTNQTISKNLFVFDEKKYLEENYTINK
tara:strand:+ start:8116 stop:8781 length:666 start_codon:yes stop_codon:yes gene_type:complete